MDAISGPGSQTTLGEVFRRVGRNLLLLQHIELLLKDLLSRSGFAGYASEIPTKAAQRAQEISRKTLGQLAQQYHDELLGQGAPVSEPEDLRGPWFSINFRLNADDATMERDKAVLAAMVAERNELAHTFLSRWDLTSAAEIDEAVRFLDAQRERAIPILTHIKSVLAAVEQGRKQVAEALMNGEAGRLIELAFLQASRIVQLLGEIAETAARPDGWTDLARAGQLIADVAPDEMASMKERYGVSSLKKLLVECEMFEVAEEPDGGGHRRTIYRKKAAPPN
jgi:hypothetical protein